LRQIDRLILKEVSGPWIFGVGLFTALLLAATYLNKIADYVVKGVPPALIGELVLLLLPAILVKTFGMAMLLAALLAFGRLSSDSEIVALKAAGASVYRMVFPVMAFSIAIAGVTFWFNEQVVPGAANRAKELLVQLANEGNVATGDPISIPVIEQGQLKAMIAARSFNLSARTMTDVSVTAYSEEGRPSYIMTARSMEYNGANDWHIRGETTLMPADGGMVVKLQEAWPDQVPKLTLSPQDIMTANNNDNDLYTMAEIRAQFERGNRDGSLTMARVANLQYGYWSKISVPLAAFIFGTLGAVLGIRSHRTGTAAGFALAVGIIFGYVTLANFMNVWALGGVLPAWVAAFLPLVLGFVCAMYLMWRRNA
jgi:lipopolysaccharide export system permease protein